MNKVLMLGIFSIYISGCATTSTALPNPNYSVTFDSLPQGASLICSGQNHGYTPQTLSYKNIEYNPEGPKSFKIAPCGSIWSSGTYAQYPTDVTIYKEGGTLLTVNRPNVPGYSKDAEFALKVKDLETRQQATAATRMAAMSATNSSQQNSVNYLPRMRSLTQQNNTINNSISCKRIGVAAFPEIRTFATSFCPVGWLPSY